MKVLLILSGILLVFILVIIVPDISRGYISDILLHFPGVDKPIHFIEFTFILCVTYVFLSYGIFNLSKNKKIVTAVLFSVAVSLIDEYHQLFVSDRSFEYADLLINSVGIMTGAVIVYIKEMRWFVTFALLLALFSVVSVVTFESYRRTKHFNMGILSEREKDFEDAMRHYLLAIESGNESSSLYNNMAWINIEFLNGDPEVSFEYVKKAMSMSPDSADILETYGWILYEMNKPQEAIIYLKKALAINPDIFCIHYHLGASYNAVGKYELSLYHLNKQLEMNLTNRYAEKSREIIEKIENRSSLIKSDRAHPAWRFLSSREFSGICPA